MENRAERVYFLDNLKTTAILFVILLHLSISYMPGNDEWWTVMNTETLPIFSFPVLWGDVVLMPLMFFVAGYFSPPGLKKQGTAKWWRGKLKRIVLPWVLGVSIMNPPVEFLFFVSRNIPMNFGDYFFYNYWTNNGAFGPGKDFEQAHFWFLGVLVLLFLLFTVASRLHPDLLEPQAMDSPKRRDFLLLLVVIFLNTVTTCLIFGNDEYWLNFSYFLQFQPTRLLIYVIFFFLGVKAWRQHWFKTGGYIPKHSDWALPALVFSIAYPVWGFFVNKEAVGIIPFLLLYASLKGGLVISGIFYLLGLYWERLILQMSF